MSNLVTGDWGNMGIRTRRSSRAAVATVIIMIAASAYTADAYTMPRGTHDGALVSFEDETGDDPVAIYMSFSMWGTQYYDGVPPQNNGGLGDAVVCLGLYTGDGVRGEGCFDGVSFVFESLRSLVVDDSVSVDTYDGNDTFLGTETVTLDVTLTGTGVPYPGIGVQLNPSPGVELQASFLRDATIQGTLESESFGSVDLANGAAVLGHDDCFAFMAGEDNVQACRF